MSDIIKHLKIIEDLDVNQLAEALELNGYAPCVGVIRTKQIDGQAFLKLTELQLSLWRLPPSEARRLSSFLKQIKHDPTQFLMNSQISNKTAPKVNTFNKPPIIDSTRNGNLLSKSNFTSNKPTNVSVKPKPQSPNIFINPVQTSETKEANSSTLTKQESKLPKYKIEEVQNPEQTSDTTEKNSSTLTKQESKLLKNKLEQVLLKKDSNETPNNSFIHNQQQPLLPPKPDHLKVISPTQVKHEESQDEDYLAPIKVDPNKAKKILEAHILETEQKRSSTSSISRDDSTRGSFLHRRLRNYNNLEIRPEVIENKYEEHTNKEVIQRRPLPPVPLTETKDIAPVITLETDDEELAEYTSVSDNEEPAPRTDKKQFRPLPAVPLEKVSEINQLPEVQQNKHQLNDDEADEELAEYTPVIEDDETESKRTVSHRIIKTSRSPLPPLNIPRSSRARDKLPTPDKEELSPRPKNNESRFKSLPHSTSPATLPKSSTTLLQSSANLQFPATFPRVNLPKPPTNLPKPPVGLPSSSNFPGDSENDLRSFDLVENRSKDKRLPPAPPVMKIESTPKEMDAIEDEESFYTEIDLAREPSYRETDRKGARLLLTGLENGAFVIRPSRQSQFVCTISIMHSTKMFNLGIERNSQGALAFSSVTSDFDQPMFYSIAEVITYYTIHPLYLSGESILLRDILPRNKY